MEDLEKTPSSEAEETEPSGSGENEAEESDVQSESQPIPPAPEPEENANCVQKQKYFQRIEKFGLVPFAVFAIISIVFSVMNAYDWYASTVNIFMMGVAALSYSIYKFFINMAKRRCGCENCSGRSKTDWVLFWLGIAGFILCTVLFIVLPVS